MYAHWIYYIILATIQFAGLFFTLLGLPGIWLMVGATAVYAWMTHPQQYVGFWTLGTLLGIALLAEIVEFLAGAGGAKKAGGSLRAAVGAIAGGLIGAFVLTFGLPVIGTIIGGCIGAFVGALAAEYSVARDSARSMRVGIASAKGRLYGIVSKLIFSLMLLLISLIAAFPVGGQTVIPAAPPLAPPTTLPATSPAPVTHAN